MIIIVSCIKRISLLQNVLPHCGYHNTITHLFLSSSLWRAHTHTPWSTLHWMMHSLKVGSLSFFILLHKSRRGYYIYATHFHTLRTPLFHPHGSARLCILHVYVLLYIYAHTALVPGPHCTLLFYILGGERVSLSLSCLDPMIMQWFPIFKDRSRYPAR